MFLLVVGAGSAGPPLVSSVAAVVVAWLAALASTRFYALAFVGSRRAQMLLPASSAPSFLNLKTGA